MGTTGNNPQADPMTPREETRAQWLAPAAVAGVLLAIAATFWVLNGPSVFAQMLASAWALCF